jgi:hypothetical protein
MLDQLGQLGLSGMAQAFAELEASDEGSLADGWVRRRI